MFKIINLIDTDCEYEDSNKVSKFSATTKNNSVEINVTEGEFQNISINPQNGNAVFNNNVITYTPNNDYIGADNFEYTTDNNTVKVYLYVEDVFETTICNQVSNKCKIVANSVNQGVAVIFNSRISVTIENKSNESLFITKNRDELEIEQSSSETFVCDDALYIDLCKYSNSVIKVNSLNDYPISAINNAKDINTYNESDNDIYVFHNNQGQILKNDGSYTTYDNVIIVNNANNKDNTYNTPLIPEKPDANNYNAISFTSLNDYKITITADSSNDVKVTNNTQSDITPKDENLNDLSVLPVGSSSVYTANTLFSNAYEDYNIPLIPTKAEAENYNKVIINSLATTIDITATTSEDVKILNKSGGDITVGSDTLSNNSSIIITENKTIS